MGRPNTPCLQRQFCASGIRHKSGPLTPTTVKEISSPNFDRLTNSSNQNQHGYHIAPAGGGVVAGKLSDDFREPRIREDEQALAPCGGAGHICDWPLLDGAIVGNVCVLANCQQASAHWRYALGELCAFSWRPFRNPPTSGHVAHIPVVAPKKGTRNA